MTKLRGSSRNILTHREIDVLRLLAVGNTLVETATLLGIAYGTAKGHVYNARRVLRARTVIHAVMKAKDRGLI